jgi:hypothetical protein
MLHPRERSMAALTSRSLACPLCQMLATEVSMNAIRFLRSKSSPLQASIDPHITLTTAHFCLSLSGFIRP